MTGERRKTPANGPSEPAVSAAYRALAAERAPASLNETVLREAAHNRGSGYAWSIAWLRPMAWAASIGLCLAIVIELAEIPDFEMATPVSDKADDFDARASRPETAGAAQDVEPPNRPPARAERQPAAQSASEPAAAAGLAEMDQRTATQQAIADSRQNQSNTAARPSVERAGAAKKESGENVAAAFHVQDAPTLEKAAAAASRLDSPDEADGLAIATGARAMIVAPPCEGAVRSSPETWLACIETLSEAGRKTEADEQQREFEAAYPDVEVPWNRD